MFSFLVDFNLKTAIVIEIEEINVSTPSKKGVLKKSQIFPLLRRHAWMFHAVMAMAMTSMMPKLGSDLKLGQNTRNVDNL